MRLSKKVASIFAGLAMLATVPAGAADAQPAPAFVPNWGGMHAGFFTSTNLGIVGDTGTIGVTAGYSFSNGRMVFGADLNVGVAAVIGFVDVRARAGVLVRPRAQAYLTAGMIFVPFGGGTGVFHAGGGVEFAITRDLSIALEVTAVRIVDPTPPPPPLWIPLWNIGINWHP